MNYLLIIGAKSDSAKALARLFASQGYNLYLACRNPEAIEDFVADLMVRYKCDVKCAHLDIRLFDTHRAFYDKLLIKPIGVICTVGYLDQQKNSELNWAESYKSIQTNYTGIVSLLNIVANDFEKAGRGFIVGFSSVAGERGRQSNYIYGSTKAALTCYLDGMRNRLASAGVHVMTVKPGFMVTQMIAHLTPPKPLTIQPDKMAKRVFKGIKSKKNTLYSQPVWYFIMFIIKNIPEVIFKRLKM